MQCALTSESKPEKTHWGLQTPCGLAGDVRRPVFCFLFFSAAGSSSACEKWQKDVVESLAVSPSHTPLWRQDTALSKALFTRPGSGICSFVLRKWAETLRFLPLILQPTQMVWRPCTKDSERKVARLCPRDIVTSVLQASFFVLSLNSVCVLLAPPAALVDVGIKVAGLLSWHGLYRAQLTFISELSFRQSLMDLFFAIHSANMSIWCFGLSVPPSSVVSSLASRAVRSCTPSSHFPVFQGVHTALWCCTTWGFWLIRRQTGSQFRPLVPLANATSRRTNLVNTASNDDGTYSAYNTVRLSDYFALQSSNAQWVNSVRRSAGVLGRPMGVRQGPQSRMTPSFGCINQRHKFALWINCFSLLFTALRRHLGKM